MYDYVERFVVFDHEWMCFYHERTCCMIFLTARCSCSDTVIMQCMGVLYSSILYFNYYYLNCTLSTNHSVTIQFSKRDSSKSTVLKIISQSTLTKLTLYNMLLLYYQETITSEKNTGRTEK